MTKLNLTPEQFEILHRLIDVLSIISLKTVKDLTGLYDDECYDLIQHYLNNRKRIDKDIDLGESPITDLSQLEHVGGDLILYESAINDLSNLQYVTNNIYLDGSPIKELPNLKYVGRTLDLVHTPIKELPKLEYIGGYLYLSNKDIDISHIEIKRRVYYD